MKKNIFLFLSFLIITSCSVLKESNKKISYEGFVDNIHLYGKVKSIEILEYATDLDSIGKQIPKKLQISTNSGYKLFFNENRKINKIVSYSFNKDTNSIIEYYDRHKELIKKAKWFFKEPMTINTMIDSTKKQLIELKKPQFEKTVIKFNNNWMPLSKIKYDSLNNKISTYIWEYDNHNNNTLLSFDYTNFLILKQYNKKNKLIEIKGYSGCTTFDEKKCNLMNITRINYVKKDSIVIQQSYDYKGQISFTDSAVYRYNNLVYKKYYATNDNYYTQVVCEMENKRIISQTVLFNEKINSILLYTYDKYDNIKQINPTHGESDTISYEYTYDKFNNWIERKKYINGKLFTRTERNIEYN